MTLPVSISLDTQGLTSWADRTNKSVQRATSLAGGDAIRSMRVEGSRQIRGRKAMKVAPVNRAIAILYPTDKQTLIWRLKASGQFMPVIDFPARQTKKGVSVEINKGARTLIKGAFIAKMKSGHLGVFQRRGAASISPIQSYRGHERYAGTKRQPIREAFTTKVSDAFKDAIPGMVDRGTSVFRATFTRVLPLEVGKGRGAG